MIYIQLFFTFFKIGLFSFGGGYTIISLMEREIVTLNGWLSLSQMVDIIAVSQITPGPIAINAATFAGYSVAGIAGAVTASLGMVMPSFLIVLLIARFFLKFHQSDLIHRIFLGLRPMVVALITSAGLIMVKSAIIDYKSFIIMAGTFLALKFLKSEPILVIFAAGMVGIILY